MINISIAKLAKPENLEMKCSARIMDPPHSLSVLISRCPYLPKVRLFILAMCLV